MTKQKQNKEIVDRYFYVETKAGSRFYAGKSVITEGGKVILLRIGNETYYGYKPKAKSEGEEGA